MSEYATILFPFDQIEKGSKIVIYGAGDVGQLYFAEIEKTKYAEVVGWIDRAWEGLDYLDEPKISKSEILKIDFDYIVIAIELNKHQYPLAYLQQVTKTHNL